MDWKNNVKALWLAAVVDAILFFLIAFSDLPDGAKVIGCLLVLLGGGMYMAKNARWENYFGISLVRSKRGLALMSRLGRKFPALFRFLADVGAGAGYGIPYSIYVFRKKPRELATSVALTVFFSFLLASGSSTPSLESPQFLLLFASGLLGGLTLESVSMLGLKAFRIFTIQNEPAGAQLVIPGLTVPWEWLFGLAIAATVHEMAHGVLCRAESLKVKSSGAILFGFLPLGAFVEPDEAEFSKISLDKKRRILAAGPAANLVAFFLFGIAAFAFAAFAAPVAQSSSALMVVDVNSSFAGSSALSPGDFLQSVDGVPISSVDTLHEFLAEKSVGQVITFGTQNGEKNVVVGPGNRIGISVQFSATSGNEFLFWLLSFVLVVLSSTAYLNLAIGMINLVPLFVTDGGRLAFEEFAAYFEKRHGKRRGREMAQRASFATSALALVLVLVNLLLPSVLKLLGFLSQLVYGFFS